MTAPSPEAPEQGEQAAVVGGWTKGPWKAGHYSSVVGVPIMAQPDPKQNTLVIAGVMQTMATDPVGRRSEAQANARLIAAAPQMAEALQAALRARVVRDGDVVDQMRATLLAAGAEVRS